MKPVAIESTATLPGIIERVWELITDWEHQVDWMLEMSDIVVTSEHRTGVGVEALATVKVGGIRTRDIVRIDVWEPPRHLGMVHEGWVRGRGDIRLTPTPEGTTDLAWREQLIPPWGVIGAVGLRLFRPLLVGTFKRDVRELQNLVEKDH